MSCRISTIRPYEVSRNLQGPYYENEPGRFVQRSACSPCIRSCSEAWRSACGVARPGQVQKLDEPWSNNLESRQVAYTCICTSYVYIYMYICIYITRYT